MIEVSMSRFFEILFTHEVNLVDLWWGEDGRIGLMHGKVLRVTDFSIEALAEELARRLNGQVSGNAVELPTVPLSSEWFLRIFDPETQSERLMSGRLGQVGPVMISCISSASEWS